MTLDPNDPSYVCTRCGKPWEYQARVYPADQLRTGSPALKDSQECIVRLCAGCLDDFLFWSGLATCEDLIGQMILQGRPWQHDTPADMCWDEIKRNLGA